MNITNTRCTCGQFMICDTDFGGCHHKPTQSIASTDTTPADLGGATGKGVESFEEYIKNTRNEFSKLAHVNGWWYDQPAERRVMIEDLLIAYDQMAEQYAQLRVSEVREQGECDDTISKEDLKIAFNLGKAGFSESQFTEWIQTKKSKQ
jgi:hypothetical protein